MNSAQKIILQAGRFLKSRVSFTKTVAMTTVVAFIVSSIIGPAVYAANTPVPGVAQTIKESLSAFQLPYSLGRITDAKYLGSKKVVVAIQDLHCHPEVQRNIASLLGIIDERFGKSVPLQVFVEGGIGPMDTSWVNKISDPKMRAEAVETLMAAGRLTGAEYYSIQKKKYGLLQGLEDGKPYFENLVRLNEIMDAREGIATRMAASAAALEGVKEIYYTSGNRRLDKIVAEHEARSIETVRYYKLLLKLAVRAKIGMYDFPATENFLEVMDQQRRLPYKKINNELTKFIGTLKEKLPFGVYNQLMEKASRPNGIEEVYITLAKVAPGMDVSKYPSLAKFFQFVEKNQRMNPLELVREERRLISELRGRLSQSRAEREVAFIADFLQYVKGYYENKMSADDYAYFTEHAAAFYQLWERYASAQLLPSMREYAGLFAKYYETNIERNRIFMETVGVGGGEAPSGVAPESVEENIFLMNTQLSLAEAGCEVDVVVTGGFHTEGLAKILEAKGISYVVITPNVTGGTEYAQRMYNLIARDLVNKGAVQANIARTIAGRYTTPSESSLALLSIANQFAAMSEQEIILAVRETGFQSAVMSAMGTQISVQDIVKTLKDPENAEAVKLQGFYSDISAVDGSIVITLKNNDKLYIPVEEGAEASYARHFMSFKDDQGEPVTVRSLDDMFALVKTMERFRGDDQGAMAFAALQWAQLTGGSLKIPVEAQRIVPYGKEGFSGSSMIGQEARETVLGGEDHHAVPELHPGENLSNVHLVEQGLNAGLGESVSRKTYVKIMRGIRSKFGRTGREADDDVKLGAKGTDIHVRYKMPDGEIVYISVAEMKLLRVLQSADPKNPMYERHDIQELVSTGAQDSRTSVLEMYGDENLFSRLKIPGAPEGWGNLTYREIAEMRGVNIIDPFNVPFMPGLTVNGKHVQDATGFDETANASGSHGLPFFMLLANLTDPEYRKQMGWDTSNPDNPVIMTITNSDGINNVVDAKTIKWVRDNRIPMTMISTTRTLLDVKGGIIGLLKIRNKVLKWMVERGVAKGLGEEQLRIFGEVGVNDDESTYGEKGKQYFNTNSVVMNLSVLVPILEGLQKIVGREKYLELITPDPIASIKGSGENQYWQVEGAMGTVILKLAGFIEGKIQEGDPAFRDLLKTAHFLRILNIAEDERFNFFMPVKFASDVLLMNSDLFEPNLATGKLDYKGPKKVPALLFPDGSNPKMTKEYLDVQTILDAAGEVSLIGITTLDMQNIVAGTMVHFGNAVLKGTVMVRSDVPAGTVDLSDPKYGLPKDNEGRLLLENVQVEIDKNDLGAVRVRTVDLNPDGSAFSGSRAESDAGRGIALTHPNNVEKVRQWREQAMPEWEIWARVSVMELGNFFSLRWNERETSLKQFVKNEGILVAFVLAFTLSVFGLIAPPMALLMSNALQYTIALVISAFIGLVSAAITALPLAVQPRLDSAFVEDHMIASMTELPELTRNEDGYTIADGYTVDHINKSIADIRSKTLNPKVNELLADIESTLEQLAKPQNNMFATNRLVNSYNELRKQLTDAGKRNDAAIQSAAESTMPDVIAIQKLTWRVAVPLALSVAMLSVFMGMPLQVAFILSSIAFSVAKSIPILQHLFKHASLDYKNTRTQKGVILTAGSSQSYASRRAKYEQTVRSDQQWIAKLRKYVTDFNAKEYPLAADDQQKLFDQIRELSFHFELRLSFLVERQKSLKGAAARLNALEIQRLNEFQAAAVGMFNPETQWYAAAVHKLVQWYYKFFENKKSIIQFSKEMNDRIESIGRIVNSSMPEDAGDIEILRQTLQKINRYFEALALPPNSLDAIIDAQRDLSDWLNARRDPRLRTAVVRNGAAFAAQVAQNGAVDPALVAAQDIVIKPISNYPALQGIHALVLPKITPEAIADAQRRSDTTGATVVVFGTIDDSNDLNEFERIEVAGKIFMRRVQGGVTIIATVRHNEDDTQLSQTVLQTVSTFRGDPAHFAQGMLNAQRLQDGTNGFRLAVLELITMSGGSAELDTLLAESAQRPLVVRRTAVVDSKGPARAGLIGEAVTPEDYTNQLDYLNRLALYNAATFTPPKPATGAISPVKIKVPGDVQRAVNDDIVTRAKANGVDTILIHVDASVWENEEVIMQLHAAQARLRMAGMRMGFYVDMRAPLNLDSFAKLITPFRPDVVFLQDIIDATSNGAAMSRLPKTVKKLSRVQSKMELQTVTNRIQKINKDVTVIFESSTPDGKSSPEKPKKIVQEGAKVYLLVNQGNLENTARDASLLDTAAMIIMGPDLFQAVIQQQLIIGDILLVNQWRTIAQKFNEIMTKRPENVRARARQDVMAGHLQDGYENISLSIRAQLSEETVVRFKPVINGYRANTGGAVQLLKEQAGITVTTDMDINYVMGLVEGAIEKYYTENIKDDDGPVVLANASRTEYGKARLELMLLGKEMPANPLASNPIIEPVLSSVNNPASTPDQVGVAVMTAQQALSDAAAKPEATETEKADALAAMIELLRLYGERAVELGALDSAQPVALQSIAALLGAA